MLHVLTHSLPARRSAHLNYLALYWGGARIGRFLGAISLNDKWKGPRKAVFMVVAAMLVFLLIYSIVDLTFAQVATFLLFILLNFGAFAIGRSMAEIGRASCRERVCQYV